MRSGYRSAKMDYTHLEHRHRFAAWAAARSVQRGFGGATTGKLIEAIAAAGAPSMLLDRLRLISTADGFDSLHLEACEKIQFSLKEFQASFGRAAKLLAVYLKAMIVVGPCDEWLCAKYIHPPIDRILLRGISRAKDVPDTLRESCQNANWTKLEEPQYSDLIKSLRDANLDQPVFWMIERYWNPSGEI